MAERRRRGHGDEGRGDQGEQRERPLAGQGDAARGRRRRRHQRCAGGRRRRSRLGRSWPSRRRDRERRPETVAEHAGIRSGRLRSPRARRSPARRSGSTPRRPVPAVGEAVRQKVHFSTVTPATRVEPRRVVRADPGAVAAADAASRVEEHRAGAHRRARRPGPGSAARHGGVARSGCRPARGGRPAGPGGGPR